MQRVDGNYLYQVGYKIHPIASFRYSAPGVKGTTHGEAYFPLLVAEGALEPFIQRSVFQLRTSQSDGQALLNAIKHVREKIEAAKNSELELEPMDVYQLTSNLNKFETVLAAEFALIPLYVVTRKGGYDVAVLIESGESCFPEELQYKVPEAIGDIREGTRCIAYDLPTAAGFHLHRANESVLHRYWDAVTGGAPRPARRNMGDYIKGLKDLSAGDARVRTALRDLKDLHRNPLIHPEHSLEGVNHAIALMNNIHTCIVYMLAEIPFPNVAPQNVVGTINVSG